MLSTCELANLLRLRLAGVPFPHSFIHEADVCSLPPEELVAGLEHGPGDDNAWYICSPAGCHQGAGGAPTQKRRRSVLGGRSGERWHPESGQKPILGPDGKPVGAYTRSLSYVLNIENPAGMPTRVGKKRLGWCMVEVALQKQDGGADQQLVLCKVYRSSRTDPGASTEASVAGVGMPCLVLPPAPSCERDTQIQSIQVAMENVRPFALENSNIPQAPAGTVITETRDMSKKTLPRIELKSNITILDIESTHMLGPYAFKAKAISVFQCFEDFGISVDFVATSEGKMSFTLVPPKLVTRELTQPMLDNAVKELKKFANVDLLQNISVISLIGNSEISTLILEKALNVLRSNNVEAHKVSHESSSKLVTKISLVIHDNKAERCVKALRSAFFERNPEAPPSVSHEDHITSVVASSA